MSFARFVHRLIFRRIAMGVDLTALTEGAQIRRSKEESRYRHCLAKNYATPESEGGAIDAPSLLILFNRCIELHDDPLNHLSNPKILKLEKFPALIDPMILQKIMDAMFDHAG